MCKSFSSRVVCMESVGCFVGQIYNWVNVVMIFGGDFEYWPVVNRQVAQLASS